MRKTNKSNAMSADEPTEPPRYWNSQPLAVHFKYHTRLTKTITMVLAIMGILNHHDIDNGDVEVYTSGYTLESTPDSFPRTI